MMIIIIVIFRNYSLLRQVFSWRPQPPTLLEGAPLWPVWVIKRAPAVVLVAILQILQLKSVSHGCHQSQLFWSTVVQWKTSGNMSSSWWSSGDKPKQMEQQGEGRNAHDQKYWWRQKMEEMRGSVRMRKSTGNRRQERTFCFHCEWSICWRDGACFALGTSSISEDLFTQLPPHPAFRFVVLLSKSCFNRIADIFEIMLIRKERILSSFKKKKKTTDKVFLMKQKHLRLD